MPALGLYTLVGVLAGLWLPLPGSEYLAVILPLASGLLAWWFGGIRLLSAMLAFMLSGLHGHWYLQEMLPEPLVRQDILVRGTVSNFPRSDPHSSRFLLHTDRATRGQGLPEIIYLASYSHELTPEPGEHWQLLVRLKEPRGLVNPGLSDRALWLFRRGVNATGYVRASTLNKQLQPSQSGFYGLRLRAWLAARIDNAVGGHEAFPLLLGITLGMRQLMTATHWEILRRTGTSHLLAISGLHIGMVAVAMWQLGRWLGWLAGILLATIDAQRWARNLAGISALVYGMLAGFSIPTVRAACMALIVLMLAARQRDYAPVVVLGCVLLLALMLEPAVSLSAGFWLSYCAVALLFGCIQRDFAHGRDQANFGHSFTAYFARAGQTLKKWINIQFVLALGLALPGLIFFNQLSFVAPLANMVAIPLFSLGLLPVALTGLLCAALGLDSGVAVLGAAASGLSLLMAFLQELALLPGAFWQPRGLDASGLVWSGAGIVWLLLPRPFPLRCGGLFLLVGGLLSAAPASDGELRLDILDVGQGLAIIVRAGGKVMVYDTGPGWRGGDAGQQIVAPVLRHMGIEKVDTLVISHWDSDHSGGAASIAGAVPVGETFAPVLDGSRPERLDTCRRGAGWSWGAARFEFLHPANPAGWSDNNASCVLLIKLGRQAILLPGDIESAVETLLVKRDTLGSMQLVVVPHHGSSTSSSAVFVSETRPEYVVYSSGYANRWGFPNTDVAQRWNVTGACSMTTADTGAISFSLNAETGLTLENFARSAWSRPWPLRIPKKSPCKGHLGTL